MKKHSNPSCPPMVEPPHEERESVCDIIEKRLMLISTCEERLVLKIGTNGQTIVESETHFATRLEVDEVPFEDFNSDNGTPF